MYKKGDKVRIKTWQEMVNEFGCNGRNINGGIFWDREMDSDLSHNRDGTIIKIGEYLFMFKNNNTVFSTSIKVIKGYVNEYYLQQIKEELDV